MRVRAIAWVVALAFAPYGCGGDGPDDDNPPPPPEIPPTVAFSADDPCNATVPQPTDLFRDESGVDVSAMCGSTADPIAAAIKAALADDGVAIDTPITIPLTGEIDLETASSTAATILIQRTGTGTDAASFERLAHTSQLDGTSLRVIPAAPLEAASWYAVIVTDAVKAKMRPLGQHPAIKALLGSTPIVAGAYDGLTAETAARLERERLRIQPLLPTLDTASIRSIQTFSTSLGFARLENAVAEYRAAVADAKFPYRVDTVGGELAPVDVYPAGTPPSFYANVRAFLKGAIHVPKVVGDDGRVLPNWASAGQVIRVPFLMALPPGGNYTVVIYAPGLRGSKQDIREIASSLAGPPRAATFGIDLRCHGDRSLDANGLCKEDRTAQEISALTDVNSNGNPERTGPDGVPDNSGVGYFPGDAQALRDTQIATVIELVHIVETFQRGGMALMASGITPNTGDIHLMGHGHAAQAVLLASTQTRGALRTVVLPSGGGSTRHLVEGGPMEVKTAFDATLPEGVTSATRAEYLTRLETSVLEAVSITRAGPLAKDRYNRSSGNERMLLPHGAMAELVPQVARMALISAIELPSGRVSRHNGDCDAFYLHTCRLGDNIAWGERAREQLATFVSSAGVTVLTPAP